MPTFFPATDPVILASGPVGQISRDEYMALMIEGGLCRPKVFLVNPGRADHINPDVYTILGENLIPPGWMQSRLVVDTAVANSAIEWIAVQPGLAGDALQIEYTVGVGALTIAYAAGVVTVDLAAGGSTANAIIAALPGSGAEYYVTARNVFGSTGAGTIIAAAAATNLAGGTGQAFRQAQLLVDPAGANNAILYRAVRAGDDGDLISVGYTVGLPVGTIPVITVVGNAIVVQIEAGVTVANDILRAFEASTAARALVSAQLLYGDTGAGTIAGVVAVANLAGGTDGAAVRARIGGLECPVMTVADGTIVLDAAAIAGAALNDMVLCEVEVCGYHHVIPMVAI